MATITESFVKADSDTIGPDLTWTEVVGDADIVGNKVRCITSPSLIRADSDLASANHYAQASFQGTLDAAGIIGFGPICRKDSSATLTYYLAWLAGTPGAPTLTLYKTVAGTVTAIGSSVGITLGAGDVIRIEASSDQITVKQNGTTRIGPSTDSSITSGTRTGLRFFDNGSANFSEANAFEAGDIGSAAASLIYFQPAIAPLLVR